MTISPRLFWALYLSALLGVAQLAHAQPSGGGNSAQAPTPAAVSGNCAKWNGQNKLADAGAPCAAGSGSVSITAGNSGVIVSPSPLIGTGTVSLNVSGTPTSGNCVKWLSSLQLADAGSACGGGTTLPVAGAVVVGGSGNSAVGTNAFVGGGSGNTAPGLGDVTAGGYSNTHNASARYSTISGGLNNTTGNAWYQTIAGGVGNSTAGDYAAVGGGQSNQANNTEATVLGGHANTASGIQATAGGWGSTASGTVALAVGNQTLASGYLSTAFGNGGTASGSFSTVLGQGSTDDGDYGTLAFSSYSLGLSGNQHSFPGRSQVKWWTFTGTNSGASAGRVTSDFTAANGANCGNMPTKTAASYDVDLVAVDSSTGSAGAFYVRGALFSRNAGNIVAGTGNPVFTATGIIGGVTFPTLPTITADTTNQCVNVSFTPPAGNTDTWNIEATVTAHTVRFN